jgi:hypothetical protein
MKEPPSAAGWAPVVYGRTAAADAWWQAIPEGADDSGWLVVVVRAVFAGGSELDAGPRFLLAQDAVRRIVGVACRARNLSDRMCSDGQRELSCFVGWMTSRAAAAGPDKQEGPTFADLSEKYTQWAAPVYEEVMNPVWELQPSPFRRPAITYPAPAPWDGLVISADAEHVPCPDGGHWPAQTWPSLWAAATAAADPFTCVVGWQHVRSAQDEDVTHLGAADAPPREPPPAPAPEASAGQPPNADDPDLDAVTAIIGEPPSCSADTKLDGSSPDQPSDSPATRPHPEPAASRRQDVSAGRAVSFWRRAGAWPRARLRSLSRRVLLAAIGALAAAVTLIVTIVIAGNSPPQSPSAVRVTILRAAKSTPDAWFVYRHGVLQPGQRTRKIAPWTRTARASPRACITLLRIAVRYKPAKPHPGLELCFELSGQPGRYGIADIKAVTPSSVQVAFSIWP